MHVQLFLTKQVLKAHMISKHLKLGAKLVMPPHFKAKNYSSQLQIMGGIIPLMSLEFFKSIGHYLAILHQYAS